MPKICSELFVKGQFFNGLQACDIQICVNTTIYYVDEKTPLISLFNNSEKRVQILLKFSQQIVEGYEFVLAKFR